MQIITLGPAWANASNTPYKKYKSSDYEGGACTPFIACWPGVIKPGTITDQVGHIIDILPTFMELAETIYPQELNGQKLKPVSGTSLLPILTGGKRKPHDALFWQYGQGKAVRTGDWKLVKFGDSDWELYNLKEDRTELNNLVKQHPQKVSQMSALFQQWREECVRQI